ncbi:MAG: 50S ribosomal protein L15 [bacterium]
MQLNQLKPNNKKSRKRVGRGGKKGTYAGRGLKGQKSRSGKDLRVGFAGGDTSTIMRLPKQRGTVGHTHIRKGTKLSRYTPDWAVFNLGDIDKLFKEGETVSPKSLLEKKVIYRVRNKIPSIKILGTGKLTKKIKFEDVKLSKSVKKVLGITDKKKSIKKENIKDKKSEK